MSEWQPIETCPTDLSEFLAWDARARKMDVCYASREPSGAYVRPVQVDGEYGPHSDEFGYESGGITHWMPLPNPPGQDSANARELLLAEIEAIGSPDPKH